MTKKGGEKEERTIIRGIRIHNNMKSVNVLQL